MNHSNKRMQLIRKQSLRLWVLILIASTLIIACTRASSPSTQFTTIFLAQTEDPTQAIVAETQTASSTITPTAIATTPMPTMTMIATTQTASFTMTPSSTAITSTSLPTASHTSTATTFTGIIPTVSDHILTQTATQSSNSEAQPTPSTPSYLQHIVRRGETLTRIANQYNVTVTDLLISNNISVTQILYVGDILLIPVEATTPSAVPPTQELPPTPILPPPDTVNGLAYDDFLIMPDTVIENIRSIYARGQKLGRNPHAFTRIGDSTIEAPHFFYRFDQGNYNLGDYAYLQTTINFYSGSFGHNSVGVIRGLHSWSVLDPMWATGTCEPNEHILTCEFRQHNPALIFIRLGSNDRGALNLTRDSFESIIRYCIDNGVIPIMGTKADRFDGINSPVNGIIREMAAEYQIPLWDFDRIANTLPNKGLLEDGVHLTYFYAHDWRANKGFTTGHGLHNLTALIVLDEVHQVVNGD